MCLNLPEEAVEAAVEAHMPWTWPDGSSPTPDQRRALMENALQAAAPTLRKQGAEEAEARFRGALAKLWERAEAEKDKTAAAFDERDKMAGDEGASTEACLLDDFHRCLEELFPRCGGEGFLDVVRGSEAGAVFDTEPCPGCPDCLFADHDTTAIDQALAKGAEEYKRRFGFREGEAPLELQDAQAGLEGLLDGIDLHDPNCGIPHPADPDQGPRGCTCGIDSTKERFNDAIINSLYAARAQGAEEERERLRARLEALAPPPSVGQGRVGFKTAWAAGRDAAVAALDTEPEEGDER